MSLYLQGVYAEAAARGYAFKQSKIQVAAEPATLLVTTGQLDYEWAHLMNKLKTRNLALYQKWQGVATPAPHPIFELRAGQVESWERQ